MTAPFELKWKPSVIFAAYKAAADIFQASGQRHASMLILAAFIIAAHSKAAGCSAEETTALVSGFVRTEFPSL